ncbi:hypothetical protein [Actinoplanes auranticolor]|uniref:Uncharacterized protein n=1 Tax=Actinoplanes auranticolor TaxID=47988 RepID=A0A919S2N2_9ACTN|nr:hypothetical protein [Actinoplanes auranticolor]GIM63453.1 hypothetical protein Aau02nite_04150 [Actinoplanes auranticolor]
MMLEDDLRATLRERAEEPAPAPDLLDAVRGGVRRADRRRAAVLGAAAVLVAVVAVPVAIAGGRPSPPAPQGSAPATGWQRPRLDLPLFPLTPGWAPPGLGTGRVGRVGPTLLLTYEDSADRSLELSVGPEPGDWGAEGEDRAATVHGRPATVRTLDAEIYEGNRPGDRYVGVRWQLADGRWVQLGSSSRNTESEMLRFANGLRLQAMPPSPLPFTVATAPPGLVLQVMTENYMCLAPPASLADGDSGHGLCIGLGTAAPDDEPSPEDEQLTVRGEPATLETSDRGPVALTVRLDAQRLLSVTVEQNDLILTRDQLIRFAEGITVPG